MEGMIMTAQVLLSLSILIAVHEWGHFVTARMFNIKVEKFYLFFDFLFPMTNVLNFSLFKYKKGDTEYGIGWFPLGGYVKIAGMVDESMDKEQLKKAPKSWEFRAKPAWQRLIVMLGGIIVNVITGVLIFIGITYFLGDTYISKDFVNSNGGIYALELGQEIGFETGDKIVKINGQNFIDFQDMTSPDVLLSPDSYYTVVRDGREINIAIPTDFIDNFGSKEAASKFLSPRVPAVVGRISKVAPFQLDDGTIEERESISNKVGLKPGDEFLEIEGKNITYQDEIIAVLHKESHDTISFKVQRNSEVLTFKENFKGFEVIGFFPKGLDKSQLASINYNFVESVGLGTERAFAVIFVQLKAFRKMLSGEMNVRKSLAGPIGIAQAFGAEWDWERFWGLTGLLSMVLAFMNLLPIPALDGGYVVFLLYEIISGREPSEKFFETSLKIGMAMLLVLMGFAFYNDIAKLVTGG